MNRCNYCTFKNTPSFCLTCNENPKLTRNFEPKYPKDYHAHHCDEHGGFGFMSDCWKCNDKKSKVIEL